MLRYWYCLPEGLGIELKSDTVLSCHHIVIHHAFAVGLTYRVRSSDCGASTAVLNQTVRVVSV